MKTQYAGIDYSLGRSNTDANGIRYGVISQNSVSPDSLDDIDRNGKDLAWEKAMKEKEKEWNAHQETLPEDEREGFDETEASDELGMNWEHSFNNLVYQEDGYKITGCLDSDLFILASPFYTYASYCSPCAPGAGNLNSPFESECTMSDFFQQHALDNGFPKVYCLGHNWFEDGKAPYVVFDMAGNIVSPKQN